MLTQHFQLYLNSILFCTFVIYRSYDENCNSSFMTSPFSDVMKSYAVVTWVISLCHVITALNVAKSCHSVMPVDTLWTFCLFIFTRLQYDIRGLKYQNYVYVEANTRLHLSAWGSYMFFFIFLSVFSFCFLQTDFEVYLSGRSVTFKVN